MTLGEKVRYLRSVEGSLRGLGRPMTQAEVSRAMRRDLKKSITQSHLSQIESGARPHLTTTSRALLATFFQVHPGFLVDDPEGFHADLRSDLRIVEEDLDTWLLHGAERFRGDTEVHAALAAIAAQADSRAAFLLLASILATPGLDARLRSVLEGASPTRLPAPPPPRRPLARSRKGGLS